MIKKREDLMLNIHSLNVLYYMMYNEELLFNKYELDDSPQGIIKRDFHYNCYTQSKENYEKQFLIVNNLIDNLLSDNG